jgi:F0F1-type ATP synthase epsilon subunit
MRQRSIKSWIAVAGLVAGMSVAAVAQAPDGAGGQIGSGGFAGGGQMVRGTVTVVAADKLTMKTDAGDVYQVALSANTRLMKARQPVKVTEIKVGDGVGAMGVLDGPTKTVHALMVTVVDAEEVKKAREEMGKVYIAGKVTAIDDLKLTVLRTDGVSQVIAVDESTSFRKGDRRLQALLNGGPVDMGANGGSGRQGGGAAASSGESITLVDIKVGDTVAGQGGMKNGVFVPTELGVLDAAAGGQRRRRQNADGATAGANGAAGAGAAPAVPNGSAATPQ